MAAVDLGPGPAAAEPHPPTWAGDPTGRCAWRYWDGSSWTGWASNGGEVGWDPVVPGPAPAEVAHLEYLRAYLVGAAARGVVGEDAAAALDADVAVWSGHPYLRPPAVVDVRTASPGPPPTGGGPGARDAAPALPGAGTVTAPGGEPLVLTPAVVDDGPGGSAGVPPVPGRPPHRRRRQARRVWHELTSELALHGLADLGALLVFAGLFGFVAFAFGSVAPWLRPVAEVLIPTTAFLAGAVLRRSGTRQIGDALVVLGGALVPVVLIASFTDDAVPPPDLDGAALVLALVASLAAVAGIEALVVRRRPTDALRFVVVPTLWLAVAAAGLGIGRPVPTGSDVSGPGAVQWALVAVAVALSVGAATLWPGGRWSQAVRTPALPATALAYTLTLLATGADDWFAAPVVVAAAAAIVTLELVAGRRHRSLVLVTELTLVVVTASAVARTWSDGWVAAGVTLVLLALAETGAHRGAARRLTLLTVVAAAAAITATTAVAADTPMALVVASGGAWCWVALQTRWSSVLARSASTLGVWVLPVPFAAGLAAATSAATATFVVACVVAATGLAMLVRAAVRTSPWTAWVPGLGAADSVAVLAQIGVSNWATVLGAALVAVVCAAAPLRRTVKVAVVPLAALAAGLSLIDLVDLEGWDAARVAPLAVALVGAVVAVSSIALVGNAARRTLWVSVTGTGLALQALATTIWLDVGNRYPSGLWVVGGTAASCLGLAVAAAPSGWRWPRHAAAVVGSGSALLLAVTLEASAEVVTSVAAAVTVLTSCAVVTLRRSRRAGVWWPAVAEVSGVSAVVAVGAAASIGHGWASLALVCVAAALAIGSIGAEPPVDSELHVGAVVAVLAAAVELGLSRNWEPDRWTSATAVIGAALVAISAGTARLPAPRSRWAVRTGALGGVLVGTALTLLSSGTVDRTAAGPWVAGALAVCALATGTLAHPSGWSGWRFVAVVVGLGSVGVLLDALGADGEQFVVVAAAISVGATAAVAVLRTVDHARTWVVPTAVAAGAGLLGVLVAGPSVGSEGFALGLLLLGMELATAGTVMHRPVLVEISPSVLCAAWLVLAADVLDRGPTWFTVPVGATLLVTVELSRADRRRRGVPASSRALIAVELLGSVVLVATPLVQIVRDGSVYAVPAVALGLLLAVWGTATKVRRRLVAGVATVGTAAALLLVVPMVDLARRSTGPVTWLLVAGAGIVIVGVAAVVDRTRSHRASHGSGGSDLLAGWE